MIQGFKGAGWGSIILGIISIILGIILLMNVQGAAVWMPWTLGIMAIFGGIAAIFRSFGVRNLEKEIEARTQ